MKRYVVTVDFYVWCESDQEAIQKAQEYAKNQREKEDDRCGVVSVHDASDTFRKPIKIK